jgi:hypothetical protein
MTQDELNTFLEEYGLNPRQAALLLGSHRPVIYRMTTGERPVPLYLERAIFFFRNMPKSKREREIAAVKMKQKPNKGMNADKSRAANLDSL